MSVNIKQLLEEQRHLIHQEKKRLGIIQDSESQYVENVEDYDEPFDNKEEQSIQCDSEEKENTPVNCSLKPTSPPKNNQNAPLVEKLDLSCNNHEDQLEKDKQAFIDKLVNSENPLTFRSDDNNTCTMLRYGEYSPNNPQLRVNAAPYLGLGEYEQRKDLFQRRRQADYREYKEHINNRNERIKNTSKFLVDTIDSNRTKSVQTDIKNIRNTLIQYTPTNTRTYTAERDLSPSTIDTHSVMHNNRSPILNRLDQRITAAHNSLFKHEMDKPRGILTNRRTESPRERLLSDLKHTYVPSGLMDGFSYSERSDDLERQEKIKREIYQNELRLQIEEKRRIASMREEQERREQELENRRLEQQLLRMQEEQFRDEQRRNRRDHQSRRNSDDFHARKQELQQSRSYRKHTDSESSVSNLRNTNVASKLSHYSPPVSRRNPYSFNIPTTSVFSDPTARYNPSSRYDQFLRKDTLNRMDSLNIPLDSYNNSSSYGNGIGGGCAAGAATSSRHHTNNTSQFSRYDSLSRIDSLKQDALYRLEALSISDSLSRVQRRHSATQQDLSMTSTSGSRRSPKLQRRSSSSRFEDSLPIPVLKAHSPVARELKNSIAVNSTRHSSDAVRKLEDKWQIPAVQKNIINHGDLSDGQSRSILTQLGAIRMQLQQEQLRMDETLRKRGITQSKAVDFH